MANDYKQLAVKRLEIFRNECKEQNVSSLTTSENTRLKTIFVNDLSEKYGRSILDTTFDDLLSDLMGSGIKPIEQYIQSLSNSFPFLNNVPTADEPEEPLPQEVAPPVTEEEREEALPNPVKEEPKVEKTVRTRKRNIGNDDNDILWTPDSSSKANTRKVKELQTKINAIAKDRDILHRQFSIYRQDYAIIQGIIEYGKKGSNSLECNGLFLDNQQNVIHAALENLIKDLQANGMTDCFQNIKKYREMASEEAARSNEKISKLEKELQKLIGQ